ncbi:SIMPL domain-containing protein [Sneathia vaginalis]|jgi:hypothetical protein|nr:MULTISPECIES: SIMPL domain-containing protein [Sneathia]MBE2989557.1 SIMPL domain-containing protein [Sneathia sp. DSM 16630]MBE3030984.1 SIMPL domain-containing protein [Sneathia sp. DSM 16631]
MKKMYDIVIAIILALGAIISVAIFSNAIDRINKKSEVVIVKGTATMERPIDEYSFTMTLDTTSKEIDSVYEAMYDKEDKISNNIQYKYTKDKVDLTPITKKDDKTVIGYDLTSVYTFTSKNLDDIKKIREDVNKFSAQYPDISLSDIDVKYGEINANSLIEKASKDAKNKAYNLAKENSKGLGSIVKIKQERLVINDKNVSVTVTATYEIN